VIEFSYFSLLVILANEHNICLTALPLDPWLAWNEVKYHGNVIEFQVRERMIININNN